MRAVIQRVSCARVQVEDKTVGEIRRGLVVLVGIKAGDSPAEASSLAEKISKLRIFDDSTGKMNLSVSDIGGQLLVISQFTLYGETSKGNRPSYSLAAPASVAEPIYREFVRYCTDRGLFVATGVFGADMKVLLENDGPVTLLCSTDK